MALFRQRDTEKLIPIGPCEFLPGGCPLDFRAKSAGIFSR
jgi:hypothetical protein